MSKGKHVQCTLPEEIHERLSAHCEKTHISINGVCHMAIHAYLEEAERLEKLLNDLRGVKENG